MHVLIRCSAQARHGSGNYYSCVSGDYGPGGVSNEELIIIIIIIIIHPDFLPPPRRGSNVKSDNTTP